MIPVLLVLAGGAAADLIVMVQRKEKERTAAKVFGYQDIEIHRRPVLSDMFVIRGEDEMGVREVLTEGLEPAKLP